MSQVVTTESGEQLNVVLTKHDDPQQQIIAREPVRMSDVGLHLDEIWLKGLSAGVLGTDLSRISRHVTAGKTRPDGKLGGFFAELREGRESFRSHYPSESLIEVAQRAAQPLVSAGILEQNEVFRYFLQTLPIDEADTADATNLLGAGARVKTKHEALILEQASLSEYLAASRELCDPASAIEKSTPFEHELFFTREAWDQGREAARRGGENESAGMFIGRIMQDSETRKVFTRVDCCIEVEHATEEQYAVTPTGDSYARTNELLGIRRRRLNRPHERIVGSAHGHNFGVSADADGNRRCESCDLAAYCNRTNAAASTADIDWHKTVFRGAPWATFLIWGYNAREEDDWKLYGLKGASLVRRSLRILD